MPTVILQNKILFQLLNGKTPSLKGVWLSLLGVCKKNQNQKIKKNGIKKSINKKNFKNNQFNEKFSVLGLVTIRSV